MAQLHKGTRYFLIFHAKGFSNTLRYPIKFNFFILLLQVSLQKLKIWDTNLRKPHNYASLHEKYLPCYTSNAWWFHCDILQADIPSSQRNSSYFVVLFLSDSLEMVKNSDQLWGHLYGLFCNLERNIEYVQLLCTLRNPILRHFIWNI